MNLCYIFFSLIKDCLKFDDFFLLLNYFVIKLLLHFIFLNQKVLNFSFNLFYINLSFLKSLFKLYYFILLLLSLFIIKLLILFCYLKLFIFLFQHKDEIVSLFFGLFIEYFIVFYFLLELELENLWILQSFL